MRSSVFSWVKWGPCSWWGYLNPLWLSGWREARAAHPSCPPTTPFREVKPELQTCWQWPAACKPKHPPLLCLGVATGRKQSQCALQSRGRLWPYSLPAFPPALRRSATWAQGYSYSAELLTSTVWLFLKKIKPNQKTHFPLWLNIHMVGSNLKVHICFSFHVFLSLSNIHVAVQELESQNQGPCTFPKMFSFFGLWIPKNRVFYAQD